MAQASDDDKRDALERASRIIMDDHKGIIVIIGDEGEVGSDGDNVLSQLLMSNHMTATDIIGILEITKAKIIAGVLSARRGPSTSWTDRIGEDEGGGDV